MCSSVCPTRREDRKAQTLPVITGCPTIFATGLQCWMTMWSYPFNLPSEAAINLNYALLEPGKGCILLWSLSRLSYTYDPRYGRHEGTEQMIPGWNGYCSLWQAQQESIQSNVGYLPVIPASPTQLSSIYAVLQHFNAMADSLQQPDIIAVFDQAYICKVLDVHWKHSSEFVISLPEWEGLSHFLHFLGNPWQEIW